MEEQMIAPMMDAEEDIAMLFGEDDFSDDDSERVEEEEVWEVNKEWMMAPVTPPFVPAMQPPSDGHGQLVKKMIQVIDAEVAIGISIMEIGLRVFAIEGHVQVMASQMVRAADRFERIGTQVE
nr:hypothetical protein [Tanacetum cinerariifolium]